MRESLTLCPLAGISILIFRLTSNLHLTVSEYNAPYRAVHNVTGGKAVETFRM